MQTAAELFLAIQNDPQNKVFTQQKNFTTVPC